MNKLTKEIFQKVPSNVSTKNSQDDTIFEFNDFPNFKVSEGGTIGGDSNVGGLFGNNLIIDSAIKIEDISSNCSGMHTVGGQIKFYTNGKNQQNGSDGKLFTPLVVDYDKVDITGGLNVTGNVGIGNTTLTGTLTVNGNTTLNANVGIGTNKPQELFQISDKIAFHTGGNQAVTFNAHYHSTNGWMKFDDKKAAAWMYFNPTDESAYLDIGLWNTVPGSGFKGLRINKDGNTSFSGDIKVHGNLNITKYLNMLDFDTDSPNENSRVDAIARNGNWQFWNPGVVIGYYGKNDIGTIGSGNLVVGGNVGIGTTTPTAKLDVNGDVFYEGQLNKLDVKESFSANVRVADFCIGGSPGRRPKPGRALADLTDSLFINYGNDWNKTVINGKEITLTGNVGIGTTSPSAQLDVNGKVKTNIGYEFKNGTLQTEAVIIESGTIRFENGGYTNGRHERSINYSSIRNVKAVVCSIGQLELSQSAKENKIAIKVGTSPDKRNIFVETYHIDDGGTWFKNIEINWVAFGY